MWPRVIVEQIKVALLNLIEDVISLCNGVIIRAVEFIDAHAWVGQEGICKRGTTADFGNMPDHIRIRRPRGVDVVEVFEAKQGRNKV